MSLRQPHHIRCCPPAFHPVWTACHRLPRVSQERSAEQAGLTAEVFLYREQFRSKKKRTEAAELGVAAVGPSAGRTAPRALCGHADFVLHVPDVELHRGHGGIARPVRPRIQHVHRQQLLDTELPIRVRGRAARARTRKWASGSSKSARSPRSTASAGALHPYTLHPFGMLHPSGTPQG